MTHSDDEDDEPPRVYLAGPEVFLPGALAAGARKAELCRRHGFVGLFPLDSQVAPGPGQDARIYRANIAMIRRAGIGIFNLTPFRGAGADPGTVFELGMMAGLGKLVFGYTNDHSALRDRITGAARDGAGAWRDRNGLAVEDFGNADNLMIDCCLAESGHPVVRVNAGGRLDALEGFKACLELARQALGR
jgi:nucleoside 2-deoxyribosyltransferase